MKGFADFVPQCSQYAARGRFASEGLPTAEDAVFPIDSGDTSPCVPGVMIENCSTLGFALSLSLPEIQFEGDFEQSGELIFPRMKDWSRGMPRSRTWVDRERTFDRPFISCVGRALAPRPDGAGRRPGSDESGGKAFVTVVQAPNLRHRGHLTDSARNHGSWLGAVFGQRQVRPRAMVIVGVGRKRPRQMALVADDDMVEALPAD